MDTEIFRVFLLRELKTHARGNAQAGGMTHTRLQISPGTDRECLFAQASSRKHATKEQIQTCHCGTGDSIHSVSLVTRHHERSIPVHSTPKHAPNECHRPAI